MAFINKNNIKNVQFGIKFLKNCKLSDLRSGDMVVCSKLRSDFVGMVIHKNDCDLNKLKHTFNFFSVDKTNLETGIIIFTNNYNPNSWTYLGLDYNEDLTYKHTGWNDFNITEVVKNVISTENIYNKNLVFLEISKVSQKFESK